MAQASPASDIGGPSSSSVHSMWDLWWTKWHGDRFSPSSSVLSCQYHFTVDIRTNTSSEG
jgi:hypothetical protein